jgi:hypothetical protein
MLLTFILCYTQLSQGCHVHSVSGIALNTVSYILHCTSASHSILHTVGCIQILQTFLYTSQYVQTSLLVHTKYLILFFPTEQLDVDSCVQLTGWAGYSEPWRSATWWAQAVQSPCWLQLLLCFLEDSCPWSCPKHILRSCRWHQWTSLIKIYIHQSGQVESCLSLFQHVVANHF